jgi:hypothetical protein
MGNNERANLGLLGNLGEQQRAIAQARAQGPLELARLLAQIQASQPYNLFTGQTQVGSGRTTERGSSISVDDVLGVASLF